MFPYHSAISKSSCDGNRALHLHMRRNEIAVPFFFAHCNFCLTVDVQSRVKRFAIVPPTTSAFGGATAAASAPAVSIAPPAPDVADNLVSVAASWSERFQLSSFYFLTLFFIARLFCIAC